MEVVYITNDTPNPRYVGSVCIPPGETRGVDARLYPQPGQQDEPRQPEANPLAELLALSGKALQLQLQHLGDDLLKALEVAESAKDKPRASVLTAITAEVLRRANASSEAAAKPDG